MQKLGKHVLVELWQADPVLLDDLEWVRRGLMQAAVEARCTVVSQAFHKYAPQGVSGVVVVAESHISVHTWPEHGYAAIDIFTCGERPMPEAAARYLVEYSGAGRHFMQVLDRGIPG